ncbi:hypothetical protein HDU91_005609 [Kappamyces sp. JEL0680]|nr:hypothetical protein HDU91_005609 [Kappamyces sp. JEL0680]
MLGHSQSNPNISLFSQSLSNNRETSENNEASDCAPAIPVTTLLPHSPPPPTFKLSQMASVPSLVLNQSLAATAAGRSATPAPGVALTTNQAQGTSNPPLLPSSLATIVSSLSMASRYTNNGIYAIHATFSLAELLTMTTFHLYSSTIRFTLDMAEEAVHIFDGLFGETETSKALAAIIGIFMQELQGQDDALGLTKRFGKLYALGQMTKSVTAYVCLQYLNRKRWRSLVKLHPIYQGRVAKIKGGYDPSARVKTIDMFKNPSTDPLQTAPVTKLPSLLRRASLEVFGKGLGSSSKSHDDLRKAKSLYNLGGIYGATPVMLGKSLREPDMGPEFEDLLNVPESNGFVRRRRCFSENYGVESFLSFDAAPPLTPLSDPNRISPEATPKKTIQTQTSNMSLKKVTPPPTSVQLIRKGARYVQFAVGAYGTNFLKIMGIEKPRSSRFESKDEHHNHYSLANHTDIPVDHIIASSFDSLATLHAPRLIAPVHYVVVDQDSKSVVVSLRGTLGLSDIVTDLTASYEPFLYEVGIDGYVHSGIFQSANQIATSSIRDAVTEALERHPTYSLVLTGHSLGGGCAALLSLLWSRRQTNPDGVLEFVTNTDMGLPLRSIHCYVFAVPAVMSGDLSKSVRDLVTTFIYRHDIVPCLSLGLVRDFRNITVSLAHEEGMAESVIAKVLGVFKQDLEPQTRERDDLWYWALLKTLRADMKADKLYPPGRVFWINGQETGFAAEEPASHSSDKGKSSSATTPLSICEVEDVELAFSEVLFSTSMFTDHSPHHYEGSLQLLSKEPPFCL